MKSKLAFVTGVAGFAGSFLAEELLAQGYTVAGTVYGKESTRNIDHLGQRLRLYQLDIMNEKDCRKIVARVNPDFIFHLAAFASVGKSFAQERFTYRVNFEGTLNMIEAAQKAKQLKRFIFVSSCDSYGAFKPATKLLTEDQPLNPISPYAIAKTAAEQACFLHYRQYGLPVIIARSFNHSGPRQSKNFVIPSFASQIAAIEAGKQKPVMAVGDLTARRDLSDVRDIVRGYRLAAERGKPGRVYHLSSGKAVSIKTVLDKLIKLSSVRIKVKKDQSRFRKNDIPCLRGSNRRAVQELGYLTRYKLNVTLRDTLDYWRTSQP